MADDNNSSNTMLGVLVGAIIVILVGGGILYATGMVGGPKATTVNVSVPNSAPAPQHHANVRHDNDYHNIVSDHQNDHRSGGNNDYH